MSWPRATHSRAAARATIIANDLIAELVERVALFCDVEGPERLHADLSGPESIAPETFQSFSARVHGFFSTRFENLFQVAVSKVIGPTMFLAQFV